MDVKFLNDHFNSLITSVNILLDHTSLNLNMINKLRCEFTQLVNEIRPSLSMPNQISSIPFERNMSHFSSLCQRIFFASNKSPKDSESGSICLFFSDLHYPIDLSDQYLDDEFDFEEENDNDNIVYLDFVHNDIFTTK